MSETRTNAELAKLALEGYQDEEELLLTRDAEARRLYVAWQKMSSSEHQASLDSGVNWMDALMGGDSPEVSAARDAYSARLKQIAGATDAITLARTDDQGTETMTITRNDNEVRVVYSVDGSVLSDDIAYDGSDAESWLNNRLIDWRAEGYQES